MPNIFFAVFLLIMTVFGLHVPGVAGGADSRVLLGQPQIDTRTLLASRHGIEQALDFARSLPELSQPEKTPKGRILQRHEKMAVWSTWSTLLDHFTALDMLGSFYTADFLRDEQTWRKTSFAIAYGSFLAEYRFALEFIALAEKNPALDTILNESVPELGLPAKTYGRFKLRFLNALRATEFASLEVIYKGLADKKDDPGLRKAIEEDSSMIWEMGKGKGHVLTFKNALSVVGTAGFAAWFPVQKSVAEWMGDIKVLHQGTSFISADQILALGPRLQPGDILLERREWYLSNLGLPGFWTHAALYVGSPGERRTYFDDPAVHDWARAHGAADGQFETLLKSRYPSAYAASTASQADEHLPRVLEAISEGVSFTTLEHSAAADSLAVLRPRLSKQDKAASLFRAFHYSGRPYDFNFDFQTDSSLVCSELIYKVYEPSPGFPGITFPLDKIMGRNISTPNAMVRQFDEQCGTGPQQTDMVLFLDGYERSGKALEADLVQFRKSWRRPKWHVLIQDPPEGAGARTSSSSKQQGTAAAQ